ncbi:aminodeoxychorismate synthase component I [Listeria sp. PSOL-1]|uniref:aminodeoxychorismate synthase component I n=1 Tax=Listeria sp. PSOL-1 TaxID=1844999 RepID=UPI0013D834EF|nr:aminodeoxychorismate synthase component I [Listeria sp. PSOL-1]
MSLLQFDFEGISKRFTKPIEILQTHSLAEIPAIFARAEAAKASGKYIAGYVSYEAAPAFNIKMKTYENTSLPLVWFGIYDRYESGINLPADSYPFSFQFDTTFADYQTAINEIKQQIACGNTYQVNYTIRLNTEYPSHANWAGYYQQLKQISDVPYSALLDLDDYQILSASPELFFKASQREITVRPMKGTATRGQTEQEDNEYFHWLQNDPKNRAENVMIVDLLRNDLGRIAVPGSVKVTKLCELEAYPTVWQMTSTIRATIKKEISLFKYFQALFPCGSITGAPKISTMNVIKDLETSPREVYCGAIGYITPNDEMIFSVPIRTLIADKRKQTVTYGVGGGIVWDSTANKEYQEVHAKKAVLNNAFPEFGLIESMRLENGEIKRQSLHNQRLKKSAQHFNFHFSEHEIQTAWEKIAKKHPTNCFKLRSVLSKDGSLQLNVNPIASKNDVQSFELADHPIAEHQFLAHKTTKRDFYESCRKSHTDETLLFNTRGEITEFINGNIMIEQDGDYFTPPLSVGILPGVFRQELLKTKRLQEKIITTTDLKKAKSIWLLNSVREFVQMKMLD